MMPRESSEEEEVSTTSSQTYEYRFRSFLTESIFTFNHEYSREFRPRRRRTRHCMHTLNLLHQKGTTTRYFQWSSELKANGNDKRQPKTSFQETAQLSIHRPSTGVNWLWWLLRAVSKNLSVWLIGWCLSGSVVWLSATRHGESPNTTSNKRGATTATASATLSLSLSCIESSKGPDEKRKSLYSNS